VFDRPAKLPEGAEVLATELETKNGSPQTVLAVVDAPPTLIRRTPTDFQRIRSLKLEDWVEESSS